jgi:pimeloyl-ACP methyl ester carboxylesterase
MLIAGFDTDVPVGHDTPALEIIDDGIETQTHSVPLLFVHDASHAAWCWREHFLEYFASRGYRAVAFSLGGHGASSVYKPLRTYSVDDFVDDVAAVASTLPTAPVLIGHSMGNFIVEKYLDTHRAPASVLLAPIPPRHSSGRFLRMFRRHPWRMAKGMVTAQQGPMVNDPNWVRESFFSAHTPAEDIARWSGLLGEESRRVQLDMLMLSTPVPDRMGDPVLVLGADEDGCCPAQALRATARAYRTTAEVFHGMGHDMMLEPGWEAVAGRIDEWLTGLGL